MGRQRRDIDLLLATEASPGMVAAIAARAVSLGDDWVAHGFALRIDEAGAVTARTVVPSRYHAHPHVRGRLTTDGGLLRLEATAVESSAEVIVPWAYAVAAAFCAVMTVVIVAKGHPSPGAWILGPAALLIGGFGWSFARLRRRVFAADVQRITKKVEPALRDAAARAGARRTALE